jgi:triosephosphate isomerase
MKLPLILINFKCYEQATGEKALELAKLCDKVAKRNGVNIAVSPQFVDIYPITKETEINVFSQHIDPIEPGSKTGHILPLAVKKAGVIGTLINHSERKLSIEEIGKRVESAKKNDLITICCSGDLEESKKIAEFAPDFIAYEPPELIGTGIPVSKTKPEVVTSIVKTIKEMNPETKVLCGAGIKNGEDIKKAIELSTVGVLLFFCLVYSEYQEAVLGEMSKATL